MHPFQAQVRIIAPFIDDLTVAVIRVDLQRFDLRSISATLAAYYKAICPDDDMVRQQLSNLDKQVHHADKWLADLIKAGGRELYVLIDLVDLPQSPAMLIVPLGDGADARSIAGLFCSGRADGPSQPSKRGFWPVSTEISQQIANTVFAGSTSTLQRIQRMKPSPQPDIASAFAAADDTTVQIVLLPPADMRRVVEEMTPTLPEALGGGPTTTVTRGISWVAAGINLPPNLSLHIVVQTENQQAATAIYDLVEKALKTLSLHWQIRQDVTRADKAVMIPAPKLVKNRLTLSMTADQIEELVIQTLGPLLRKARQRTVRRVPADQMKTILRACCIYTAEHKGQWPESLQALVDAGLVPGKMLRNPRWPDRKVGYIISSLLNPLARSGPSKLCCTRPTRPGTKASMSALQMATSRSYAIRPGLNGCLRRPRSRLRRRINACRFAGRYLSARHRVQRRPPCRHGRNTAS